MTDKIFQRRNLDTDIQPKHKSHVFKHSIYFLYGFFRQRKKKLLLYDTQILVYIYEIETNKTLSFINISLDIS